MNSSDVRQEDGLAGLIEGYRKAFGDIGGGEVSPRQWGEIEERLCAQCGWTSEGGANVAQLARDYGAFMLRNALALAAALGLEDGALGL